MNLLIVDDQPNVLASLLCVINRSEIGISDVYTASCAPAARELLQTKEIHILMTDIEMPVESGISLIRWVREMRLEIECILLTSHADFFYAKQAIGLDVFEYIVQPARKEDILYAIENAILRISKKLEIESLTKISETNSNLQNAVIRQMFEHWPNKNTRHDQEYSLERRVEHINHLGIHCTAGSSLVLLGVNFVRWFTIPQPPPKQFLRYQNYLSDFLSSINGKALSYYSKSSCFVSAVFAQESWDKEDRLLRFQKSLGESLRGIARIYYCVTPIGDISDAINALYEYLENTPDRIMDESPVTQVPFRSRSNHSGKTSAGIEGYFSEIEEYISRNISSPITRAEIADHLHLSPDYVSHIVRISVNSSCKELILRKKMTLARHLLRTTQLPIGEVAQRCGYDNFAYFSRVYKSYYSMIPSSERIQENRPDASNTSSSLS